MDDEGNLCIAANYGYATKLVERQNNSELETYLDDQGERISRYSGYYGILREYDEEGNNIRTTYLDEHNRPVVMSYKYVVEEKIFNEHGQQVSSRYLDAEGKPTLSAYNGFGALYEYDDKGRRVRITYLDELGEPMVLSAGYCIKTREYYETDSHENGKVKREFYFLPDGTPALLSLGQNGVYKEYDDNGQTSLMTYLDADGNPITTNKGYTSVAYTYHANNSVESTLYYDINGKPYKMSEGQFGTKAGYGQVVYLNADGTEQFNIKNFVYNNSGFVIIIAVMVVLFSAFTDMKINWLLLILYFGVIIYFTLMYREAGGGEIAVFHSYSDLFSSAEARSEILRNIWLFVPLGAILYQVFPRKSILFVPVLLSMIIEATQLFTGTGLCELDDVISNGLGGIIGWAMGCLVHMFREKNQHRKH